MASSSPSSRFLPPNPTVRLVSSPTSLPARQWSRDLPERGVWRVTGEAGSGMSSFLVDTVLAAIARGEDPNGILVVAPSKESASRLRRDLSARLLELDGGFVSTTSMVRSVHSLAFALLRGLSDEPIRLITGAEQDGVIRELLEGHAADGGGDWPAEMRPALTYVGFARQLRDLLLRAQERRVGPAELESLGERYNRPLWVGAGSFLREYRQTMALAGAHSYAASELLDRVLSALDAAPNAATAQRWHTVIVDDAQDLDPTAGELIRRIMPADGLTMVAGDLEQSVFHFRGASPEFFRSLPVDSEIDLGPSRRVPQRRVVVADSAGTQGALVADFVRRAHLDDEIPWSDIAVIVREAGSIASVRHTLLAAGVPVHLDPTDLVLAEQHLVSAILLAIHALDHPLTRTETEDLLLGPLGGADPVTLRRLLRGLRRFEPEERAVDTLALLLRRGAEMPEELDELLSDRELAVLIRIRTILEAGRAAIDGNASVEEILWEVWSTTGLAEHLMAAALRGGAGGSQADRDLDAMMALFDAAGDYVERHPGSASIDSFVTFITEQQLPTGVRDRRTSTPDAVNILTAHGAVGTQYRCVAVTGVQEGSWPSLGETGSLFGQEDLLDLLDNDIEPDTIVSHSADRLAEERRLLHVATTRATESLLVTAVEDLEAAEPMEPSRFIDELGPRLAIPIEHVSGEEPVTAQGESLETPLRVLSRSHLVAQLRRTVCDDSARPDEWAQAARQLARLQAAGVPGADPSEWWAATEPSTSEPLPERHRLSPSKVEKLLICPLNAVVGALAEQEETPLQLVRGTLAHAYFEALGRGVDDEYARIRATKAYESIVDVPEWSRAATLEDFTRLLTRSRDWIDCSRSAFTLLGVEVDVDVQVSDTVSISGRIDRLEKDTGDSAYVIDLKTGKTPPTANQVRDNLQLKTYQLALSKGVLDDDGRIRTAAPGETPMELGGASLVYPAKETKTKISTVEQAAAQPEDLEELVSCLELLPEMAAGPRVVARENTTLCRSCAIRTICPIKNEGKVLTID